MNRTFCLLIVLVTMAACSGSSQTASSPSDDSSAADDRFGWGGVTEPIAEPGEADALEDTDSGDDTTDVPISHVEVSGTFPGTINAGETVSKAMEATGGSGNYEWHIESVESSTYKFPDGITLDASVGNVVHVQWKAMLAGKFKAAVFACDTENEGNCGKKTLTFKADAPELPSAPTATPTAGDLCAGASRPVITQVPAAGFPSLNETGLNNTVMDASVAYKFKAAGGVGPYIWKVETESEDSVYYCDYHDCYGSDPTKVSSWHSSPDETDESLFNVDGNFKHGITYCDEAPFDGVTCAGELSLRDRLIVLVEDSCGKVGMKSYVFAVTPHDDVLGNLFIDVRVKGSGMAHGEPHMKFEALYRDDAGNLKLLADSRYFRPRDQYDTWRVKLDPAGLGSSTTPMKQIEVVRAYLHEQADCDVRFEAYIGDLKIGGKYFSMNVPINSSKQVPYKSDCSSGSRHTYWTLIDVTQSAGGVLGEYEEAFSDYFYKWVPRPYPADIPAIYSVERIAD